MGIIDTAVCSCFEYYTSNLPAIREKANEHGYVLWKRVADTSLVNSPPMIGPANGAEIDLYNATDGLGFDVLKHYVDCDQTYLGDYHTHPNVSAYPKELPSDSDLFRWGAMCDLCPLWELWPLFRETKAFASLGQLETIPLTQKFQIIQPARFGDILLVRPVAARHVFKSLKEQTESLELQQKKYKNYLCATGHCGSIQADRAGYRGTMQELIAAALKIIGCRVTIEYLENVHAPTA